MFFCTLGTFHMSNITILIIHTLTMRCCAASVCTDDTVLLVLVSLSPVPGGGVALSGIDATLLRSTLPSCCGYAVCSLFGFVFVCLACKMLCFLGVPPSACSVPGIHLHVPGSSSACCCCIGSVGLI